MLRIVESVLEFENAGIVLHLIDDSTGECIGNVESVNPEALATFLEKQRESTLMAIGMKEIKNERQMNLEEADISKKVLAEAEPENSNLRIPLTEKRFLDIVEFQQYTSLGKNRAADLARASDCIFRFGRRKMIDRKKFDEWCDAQ